MIDDVADIHSLIMQARSMQASPTDQSSTLFLYIYIYEDWGEIKEGLGRIKRQKSRWQLFIKCDLLGGYVSFNSFLCESKFG